MKTQITIIILILCVLSSLVCTPSGTSGLTESTNQLVAGILYEPDGVTPAGGATVIIRPRTTLPMIAGIVSELSDGMSDTVLTNSEGRYAFDDSLESGEYSLEARKGANAVFISSVTVSGSNEPVTINPDTLKPTGSITGNFFLEGGGDPTEIYVLAFGCDRFTQVKDDGSFTFNDLGEGEYRLKIITTLDNYSSFDTSGITVYSEDTTALGTITLPFSGIPDVQHVSAVWDAAEFRAVISWEMVTAKPVKYYNIYRGHFYGPDDTIGVWTQLNSHQVTDTVFIDSSLTPNLNVLPEKFTYLVAAVDSSENEGRVSAAPEVAPVQSFSISRKIDVRGALNGQLQNICITGNGTFLFSSTQSPDMHFTTTNLTGSGKFLFKPYSDSGEASPLPYNPATICVNRNTDEFYFVRPESFIVDIYRIQDAVGTFVDSIDDPTARLQGITDCEVINNALHILTKGDSLLCFDDTHERKAAWYCGNLGKSSCIAAGGDGRVVVALNGDSCDVCWYDSTGNLLLKALYGVSSPCAITVDTLQQRTYILSGETHVNGLLKVFDSSHDKIGSYRFIDWGGNAVFLYNNNPIVILGHFFYLLDWQN